MIIDLEFNYEEATAAMVKFSQKDIDDLRLWTKSLDKTKNVPHNLSDKQLVVFYNACYGEVTDTKLCIENYYKCRNNSPDFFNNRVLNTNLIAVSECFEFSVFPAKSTDGYDIIYNRLSDDNVWKFDLVSEFKLLLMALDLCVSRRGPQPGLIILFDVQFKFGHLLKINPLVVRRLIQYLQDGMPVRMKAIHVLNAGPILDKILTLVKPFMYKKFFEMITFHSKNENLEKFYEIIPRASLPPIYGGTLPDTATLHKEFMEQIKSLEPYFKSEEQQRLDARST